MDWSEMLSVGNMTLILDKFFFPRWLQTLAMWLNHNPNYTQVTEWYTGWKRMLSEELLNQPTIKGKKVQHLLYQSKLKSNYLVRFLLLSCARLFLRKLLSTLQLIPVLH